MATPGSDCPSWGPSKISNHWGKKAELTAEGVRTLHFTVAMRSKVSAEKLAD